MTDIERNSNKGGNKGTKKYDPLLELTRLFSGESAEQDMYQSGEYPVLEDDLSAYPSLPEEKPAGYRQAFEPENTASPYEAEAPFAGFDNISSPFVDKTGDFPVEITDFPESFRGSAAENRADENMPEPATTDITGDILAQVFPAADPEPKMPADNSAAFWLQEVEQTFETESVPEPTVPAAELQSVQPGPYPYEALDHIPASLSDPGLPVMEQEWPQFGEPDKAGSYPAEADGYFDEVLPEDRVLPAEKLYQDKEEPESFAAYEVEKATMGDEDAADVSALQPVSFESLQADIFPEQPARTETAPVVMPDYDEQADYGINAAYTSDESAAVTETELSEAEQEFVDVLNTLDMRIAVDDRENPVTAEESLYEPEVNTIGIESDSIADIDNFDLPVPVYNDDEAKAREHAALEQEFADIFDQRFQQMAEQAGEAERSPQDETELFAAQMPWDEPVSEPVRWEDTIDKNAAGYDWLTAPEAADDHMQRHDKKDSGGKRRFGYGLGALLVLAGAGTGAYFYAPGLFGGDTVPVIIQAEDGDVRVLPDHDRHVNTATSTVYDNAGMSQNSPQQEQLVNGTESPVDMPVEATAGDEAGDMATPDEGENITTPLEEDSAVLPPVRHGAGETAYDDQPPQSTESGLDDLSIESLLNEAAAKSLPVYVVPTVNVQPGQEKIPAVPADEKAEVRIAGHMQGGRAETAKTAAQTPTDVSAGQEGDEAAMAAVKPASAQTVTSGIEDTGHIAAAGSQVATGPRIVIPPVPDVRPETPPAPVQDTKSRAVQTKHTAQAGNHISGFYVQIASQPSHAAAQQSAATAKRQFASVLGSHDLVIVDADIPGKGTYYRVRVPVSDRAAAGELCSQYQAAGGSCFVVKE